MTATNTIPGENINLTFSGVEGQNVSVLTSGSTMIASVTIKKPDLPWAGTLQAASTRLA